MGNDISDKILQDEVLLYISERHHTTVQHLMAHLSEMKLEENEMQIIHDLINAQILLMGHRADPFTESQIDK